MYSAKKFSLAGTGQVKCSNQDNARNARNAQYSEEGVSLVRAPLVSPHFDHSRR